MEGFVRPEELRVRRHIPINLNLGSSSRGFIQHILECCQILNEQKNFFLFLYRVPKRSAGCSPSILICVKISQVLPLPEP